jgi:hypothetical protein
LDALQLFPDVSQDFTSEIDRGVHNTFKSAFLAPCAEKLILECKDVLFNDVTSKMNDESFALSAQNAPFCSLASIPTPYVNGFASELRDQLLPIHQPIVSLPEFVHAAK